MANLVNLNGESGASLVGDDTTPALTLSNTLATGPALRVEKLGAANASIAALELSASSSASVPVIGLVNGAFVSAVSIVFAASANWAGIGVMRIVRTDGTFGWIPILPDAVVTAGVVE